MSSETLMTGEKAMVNATSIDSCDIENPHVCELSFSIDEIKPSLLNEGSDETHKDKTIEKRKEKERAHDKGKGKDKSEFNKLKKQKLCKLASKNFIKDHFEAYTTLIRDSTFVCKKCGRTANAAESLCKAQKIKHHK